MGKIGKTRAVWVAVPCMLALVAAPPALGETIQEAERREYKVQVEPICKQNAEESDDILKGVRQKANEGKLGPAGRQFTRAAVALRRALVRIKRVPKPPSYVDKLTEWHQRVGDEATLLQKIGEALKERKRRRADALGAQLAAGARLTNALVVSFGFRYCRFENTLS
jgi:hypothetical protein